MSQRFTWPLNTAAGRWSGFGPYYAMFPVTFAKEMIERYSPEGGSVIDPFCGRGTVPFVAKATGRTSFGCDINPVGWIFASAKTDPCNNPKELTLRLSEIAQSVTTEDKEPENEFQQWAWSPAVLGFLRAARRNLDWKNSRTDRTLMGFILVHLHAKIGNGVSNQMRQSKAMAPDYAVRWWKKRSLSPPDLNPERYFKQRIEWRYAQGIIQGPHSDIALGDSYNELDTVENNQFDLLLTSPPYCGVTNYKYDNWIRLWLLGAPPLPEGGASQRYGNPTRYSESLKGIFRKTIKLLAPNGVACIRTDTREFTLRTTLQALGEVLPHHTFFARQENPAKTQTALYGDSRRKPGETDILALTDRSAQPEGFVALR